MFKQPYIRCQQERINVFLLFFIPLVSSISSGELLGFNGLIREQADAEYSRTYAGHFSTHTFFLHLLEKVKWKVFWILDKSNSIFSAAAAAAAAAEAPKTSDENRMGLTDGNTWIKKVERELGALEVKANAGESIKKILG